MISVIVPCNPINPIFSSQNMDKLMSSTPQITSFADKLALSPHHH